MPRGLYVHIPFCHQKCHYCNFVIALDKAGNLREKFFVSIQHEIAESARRYGRLKFDTLYFGGGTPSMLTPIEAARLLDMLFGAFDFEPGFEFTYEMNPEDADPERLKSFRNLGVNRVSLGAQSFNNDLLKNMGRRHTAEDTVRAVANARAAGFNNISLDLIISLPDQTLRDVEEALAQAVELGPNQISIYDFDLHENSVYGLRAKRSELILPSEDEHLKMAELVESRLTSAGYVQHELLNFAKPGFESKHNFIYWHNQEYLGVGPGAFSYLNEVRYQFATSVSRYFEKCVAGNWARDMEDAISPREKEIETLLTGLRLKEGVSLAQFNMIRKALEEKIEKLDGLLEKNGDRFRLSRRGRFVAETVFAQLIESIP